MPFDLDNNDADFRASEPWPLDLEYGADIPYPGKGLTPSKRVSPKPKDDSTANPQPMKGQ